MSSVRQSGKASAQSSEGKRQSKGKVVDEGEGSGKRTRTVGKQSKSVQSMRIQANRTQLRIKRTTCFFLQILKSLNVKQKTAVRQLGFGGLLEYDVASIPTTLAYWLLEHFDHLRCSLKLPNGDEVGIDAKDVELIFGFPNGGIKFHRSDRMTGIKYLETIPLEEDVDIHSMQTKVLDVDIPRNHTTC
ncbi:hypothetical protein SASPL_113535 [Salvia splendens]|uniref:Uncharacterized protein n=1 Tax=Salvia splendens TaxID=180675 RepID=A0A8X8ZZK7_SALSN|nr:hypothetical protein SASPL_113535 [Salvia splendens]